MRDSPPSFPLRATGVLGELRLANLSNVHQAEWDLCKVVTTLQAFFQGLKYSWELKWTEPMDNLYLVEMNRLAPLACSTGSYRAKLISWKQFSKGPEITPWPEFIWARPFQRGVITHALEVKPPHLGPCLLKNTPWEKRWPGWERKAFSISKRLSIWIKDKLLKKKI